MAHQKVAIYFDFQNVYDACNTTEHYRFVLELIENYARRKGRIVIKNLYTKSNKYPDEKEIIKFHKKRDWKIIFGEGGKDIDPIMISDIIKDCYERKFSATVIISGDTDFIPPARIVKQKRKPLYVLCFKKCCRKIKGLVVYANEWRFLPEICVKCKGTGAFKKPCYKCKGIGLLDEVECTICNGSGIRNVECWRCNGIGYKIYN